MKSMICSVLVILAANTFVSANQLNDVIRGAAWTKLDTTSKAVYIKGVEDSIVLLGSANPQANLIDAYDSILSKDVEQIEISVNRFYADKNNINISVVDALLIISKQLEGAPQGTIDRLLSAFRQQSLKEIKHSK